MENFSKFVLAQGAAHMVHFYTFPSPEGAEVTNRGQLPDNEESAAFDGLPQGIRYPSKAAFVLPMEVTNHGKRENADAGRDNKPRRWRRGCVRRVCEGRYGNQCRDVYWLVRVVGRLGVCAPGCRFRGGVHRVGVDPERGRGMSWRKGDLGRMANVMLGGAKLSPVWPWQRDALAAALRECRRKAIERGASADAAAEINGAVTGRDYAGTLAGLVRGGAK